jgi:hypothetical protein
MVTSPSNQQKEDSPSLSTIEQGQHVRQHYDLKPHISSLPNYLYILSFSPPVPSPFRSPGEFINNPRVLYFIGTIGAMIAGVGLPAFDIVSGYWTNGIQDDSIPYDDVIARGSSAGWIMTMVGVVYLFAFTAFLTCCKCSQPVLRRASRTDFSHCRRYQIVWRCAGKVSRIHYDPRPSILRQGRSWRSRLAIKQRNRFHPYRSGRASWLSDLVNEYNHRCELPWISLCSSLTF